MDAAPLSVITTLLPAGATPATFETPVPSTNEVNPGSTPLTRAGLRHRLSGTKEEEEEEEGASDAKRTKADDSTGLDAFLSKYHSEDDASFGDLVEKAQAEHRQKHAWLYEKELEYTPAIGAPDEQLAITGGGEDDAGKKTWAIEHRPAGLKSWKYTAKNALMYIPEGMEHSAKDQVTKATEKREVVNSNTRLSRGFLKKAQEHMATLAGGGETAAAAKAKANSEKVGVDGNLLGPSDSPKVGGYGFVATPQIHPGPCI